MSHDLQLRVADGNRIAMLVVDVLTMCLHHRIPVSLELHHRIPASLENPKTSYFWRLSEIIELGSIGRTVDFHQCACGILFVQCDWLNLCYGQLRGFCAKCVLFQFGAHSVARKVASVRRSRFTYVWKPTNAAKAVNQNCVIGSLLFEERHAESIHTVST